jgi:ribonuclease HI
MLFGATLISGVSAHHLLCNEKSAPLPESSRGNCRILWKRIWSIPIPKSAQNFLWRLARNIIPTRKNLSRKGISLVMCCPLCHHGTEDVDHLFMHCPASMAVWFASPLGIRIPSHLDFLAWMKHWLTVPDVFAQQLFCITLWMIWRHRNFTVFKNSEFVPIIIAKTAAVFTDEFNTAAKNPSVVQTSLLKPFWTPPKRGQIKVNVDADCFADGRTGWGMVARNAAGLVLCSATKIEHLTAFPLLAECLGLRWVIDWAVEQNFRSIIFETDGELVLKCMQGALKLVEIENIVLDCLEGLSKLSNSFVVSISRVSNFVAHNLASLSKFVGSCSWMGCVPDQCFSSYCKDLSFIN